MALMDNQDSLIPITPVVTHGICFICQSPKKEVKTVTDDKGQVEISKRLKKYLNIQVSDGFLCETCQKKLESVIAKVNGLRGGILVDQADSCSSANLSKWLSAVYEASEKDNCVLTWTGPSEDVHESLYRLQKESAFCDVQLIDAKGLIVSAHACVLAAGSPVLKSTLILKQSRNWLRKEGLRLKVTGISQREWKVITEYLYLGKINIVLNSSLIRSVHRAARMLKISSLATLVWRKVGSLRLKVDLSGEVGKVKMNLSAITESSPNNDHEVPHKSSDISVGGNDQYEERSYPEVSGTQVEEPVEESKEELQEMIENKKVKVEELDPGYSSRDMGIDQTFKVGRLVQNIWHEDGEAMDDEAIQEQLRMLKEEGVLWEESMYHSSDMGSPVENKTNPNRSLVFRCWFCADACASRGDLIEHVVRNCSSLRKPGSVSEKMFVPGDGLEEQGDVKPAVKRGKKRKNFGPDVETVVKKKPSYECFNDECRATFVSHSQYMAHLRQCVMQDGLDGVLNPQKHVRKVGDTLVYDEGSYMQDKSVEPSFKPFAVLCPKFSRAPGRKVYQCIECNVKRDQRRMINHLSSVHLKSKMFCCKKCPSKYGYFGSFKDHYVSCHTNQTYMCPQEHCKRVFTKKDSLNRHILMDHKRQGKQLYLCKGCGKMFKLAHHARRHEMYHRKEDRKHVCPKCYKPFATKQDLQRHSYIHSGVKPYKCSQCTYSAARKFNLILHERKHGVLHGQYSCNICGKHFITEINLKNHVKRHEESPQAMISRKSVAETSGTSSSSTGMSSRVPEVSTFVGPLQEATLTPSGDGEQVQDIDSSVKSQLDALQTVQNVEEAVANPTTSNLVYILTTGQPYDYALMDTSMLNT